MDRLTENKVLLVGVVAAVVAIAVALGVNIEQVGQALLWLQEHFGLGQ